MSEATVTVTLIVTPRKCQKCRQCEALLGRLQEQLGERLICRIITTEAPEAAAFGIALPPMLLVGDFIAAAGRVPDEQALAKLIAQRLEQSC